MVAVQSEGVTHGSKCANCDAVAIRVTSLLLKRMWGYTCVAPFLDAALLNKKTYHVILCIDGCTFTEQ